MPDPNKPTMVAAILYALSPKPVKEGDKAVTQQPLWVHLSDADKAPFLKVTDFMGQYVAGAEINKMDRAKFAAAFANLADKRVTVNSNVAVEVFLNLMVLITNA